jgi:hypothetical protein
VKPGRGIQGAAAVVQHHTVSVTAGASRASLNGREEKGVVLGRENTRKTLGK